MKLSIGERIIADKVEVAESMFLRFRGFMMRSNIDEGEGLLIPRCNWIHTLFMIRTIDAVYLDGNNTVIDMESNVRPWRICKPRFRAKSTLELYSGAIESTSLRIGEVLRCSPDMYKRPELCKVIYPQRG
jgi:uncharacterized membrane protein (UPF0127 family)